MSDWEKKENPEEVPAEAVPVEKTPVEVVPVEETPVEEVPAGEAPAEEAPAEEKPAEETPAEEIPAVEAPAGETPAEEVPAEEAPVEEAPAEEIPAAEAPAEEEDEEDEDAYEKPRFHILPVLFFLLVLVGCGAYVYGAQRSEGHFFRGTTINGVDVSGMTASQAERLFSEQAASYAVEVDFRDGSKEILTGEELGFGYVSDGSPARFLAGQDKWQWILSYFRDSTYTMSATFVCDEQKADAAVRALPELQASRMKAPVDAYMEFQDGKFVIIPEEEGETVNPDIVAEAVLARVRDDGKNLSAAVTAGDLKDQSSESGDPARTGKAITVAELENAYAEPAVRSDDEALNKKVNKLNKYLSASITYILPDGSKRVLDSETTIKWLSKDKNGQPYKDDKVWDKKVEEFVDKLFNDTNTMGRSRKFNATGIGQITIKGGDYGYQIDWNAEYAQLKKELDEGKQVEREPNYWNWEFPGHTMSNDGIGDDYIEVNLSAQMVYIYRNGKQVLSTPCVSGTTSTNHGTPTGIYGIMFKKKDATLTGDIQANGRPEYETKVKYWMPFYNGCGFHDAWWRSAFGGTIYKTGGSHGCVNLPAGICPKFYENVEVRMPVILYY